MSIFQDLFGGAKKIVESGKSALSNTWTYTAPKPPTNDSSVSSYSNRAIPNYGLGNIEKPKTQWGVPTPLPVAPRTQTAESTKQTTYQNPINVAKEVGKGALATDKVITRPLVKGVAKFGLSAGEAIPRLASDKLSTKEVAPTYIPGLSKYIGEIQSYQSEAIKAIKEGRSVKQAILEGSLNVALDEPVGVALKPLFFGAGVIVKGLKKAATSSLKLYTLGDDALGSIMDFINIVDQGGVPKIEQSDAIKNFIVSKGGDVKNVTDKQIATFLKSEIDANTAVRQRAVEISGRDTMSVGMENQMSAQRLGIKAGDTPVFNDKGELVDKFNIKSEDVTKTNRPGAMDIKRKGTQQAYGAVAGIEEDENGNLRIDPLKAAFGIAGMGAIKKVGNLPLKQRLQERLTLLRTNAPTKKIVREIVSKESRLAKITAREEAVTAARKGREVNKIVDAGVKARISIAKGASETRALLKQAEEAGVLDSQIKNITKESLNRSREQLAFMKEALDANPASEFAYFSKGKRGGYADPLYENKGGKALDDVAAEVYGDMSGQKKYLTEVQEDYGKYLKQKDEYNTLRRSVIDDARTLRLEKSAIAQFEKEVKPIEEYGKRIAKAVTKDVKGVEQRAAKRQVAFEKREAVRKVRTAKAVTKEKIKTSKEILENRRKSIRDARDAFSLTDTELKSITRKDVRLMSNYEFHKFIDDIRVKAEQIDVHRKARIQLLATIEQKELKNTENVRRAMGLPTISEMTTQQMVDLEKTLDAYKQGDEFLTTRQLQTIHHTDLAGLKTVREVIDHLAQKTGVTPEAAGIAKPHPWMYDTQLARQDPFNQLLVEKYNESYLKASERTVDILKQNEKLTNAARSSRTRSFGDYFVPKDENIQKWLEADSAGKATIERSMTKEEVALAEFQDKYYKSIYSWMQERELGRRFTSRFENSYYPHTRRGFLETWKDEGFIKALKEARQEFAQDEAMMTILNEKTGDILPYQKWVKFEQFRSGKVTPTKNTAAAFKQYVTAVEKARQFDEFIPEMMTYAYSLSPRLTTKAGVELDDTLQTFFKKWINSKKGRVEKQLLTPGGKADWALRTSVALLRVRDLGFNLATQIASGVGEQAGNLVMLRAKYPVGIARLATKQGQAISRKYEHFVSKSMYDHLIDPAADVGDKLMTGMLGIFGEASRKANQTFLLSMMTKEEFRTGTISVKRLSELRNQMGRYRVVDGAESIVGKSAEAAVVKQHKKWAIPMIVTSATNVKTLAQKVSKEGIGALKSQEGAELLTASLLTATVGLGSYGYYNELKEKGSERNFVEDLLFKTTRETLSLISALDPQFLVGFTKPRLVSFLTDLAASLDSIVKMEEYKEGDKEGQLKGVEKLKKTLTPVAISQAVPEEKTNAEKAYEKLKTLPKEEANERVRMMKEADPSLYRQVKQLREDEKAGVTDADKEIRSMGVENGERARAIFDNAQELDTKEEKNAYLSDLKKKGIITDAVGKQIKDLIKDIDVKKDVDRNPIETVGAYAKAFFTDPGNATKALFTKEQLGKVEGNLVEMKRFYGREYDAEDGSEAYIANQLKLMGIDKSERQNYRLEHIVPVSAGGDSSPGNLRVVTVAEHESYTETDIMLGKAVKNGTLTRKEAEKLARDYKNGRITKEEYLEGMK